MAKRTATTIEAEPQPSGPRAPSGPRGPVRTLTPDPRYNALVSIERFAADGSLVAAVDDIEALKLRDGVWHVRAAAVGAPPKVGDILTESDGARWRVSELSVPLRYGTVYLVKAEPA